MTTTRIGLWNGKFLTLFPRKLQNTAQAPTLLPAQQYARSLRNILPSDKRAGTGAVRYGVGKKGDAASADILEMWDFRKADGTLETLVYLASGKLQRWNEGAGTFTDVKTGLNVNGLIGAIQFNSKLVFWNGLDNNFSYDGATVTDLGEFVSDMLAGTYTWVSSSSITIKPQPGRGATDYPNGRQIRVGFASAGLVSATVSSTVYDAGTNVLTINVTGTPFPASTQVISSVETYKTVPPMSFIYAEHDMLWGLSGGLIHPSNYRGADSLKVFYTPALNNENSWFDQGLVTSTQEVAFFNIRNKAKVFDELLAIASFNGFMVFYGRKQLYLYQGDNPNVLGEFVYDRTVKVGLVHQKLVQQFPNDLLFVTPYGARSMASAIQTEALKVSSDLGSDVDPTISDKIRSLKVDVGSYRRAKSFYYDLAGLYGFKLDDTSLMLYALNETSKGWTEFDGYFADASCFLPTGDERLLLARGSQIYAYGNDADTAVGQVYSDDGAAIKAVWWIPWLQSSERWSNRAFEFLVEGLAGIKLSLERSINLNDRNVVASEVTIGATGAVWDGAQWDEADWDGDIFNPVVSDKFLVDSFSVKVTISTTTGPLNILGLRPIGR